MFSASGDEVELFVNFKSQGRLKKEPLAYRFRWDDVTYELGDVTAVVYNDGKQWATDAVVPRVEVVDSKGNVVLTSNNAVQFDVSSPGVIVRYGQWISW